MKAEEFELKFTHQGKKINGNCQKFKVHRYPQIRVVVERDSKKEDCYIFYEINDNKKDEKYFWFRLPEEKKEGVTRSIAKALEKT